MTTRPPMDDAARSRVEVQEGQLAKRKRVSMKRRRVEIGRQGTKKNGKERRGRRKGLRVWVRRKNGCWMSYISLIMKILLEIFPAG